MVWALLMVVAMLAILGMSVLVILLVSLVLASRDGQLRRKS